MATIDEIKARAEECMGRDECLFCSWFRDVWCDRKTFARETLEAIKRLEATQPKWISVDERLPENEVMVLAINHRRDMIVGCLCDVGGEYWCETPNEILRHITHWMPLPEPPKEET